LAYPQADVECDLYMEVLKEIEAGENSRQFYLQIIKKIYGQNRLVAQGGVLHLKKGMLYIGFIQSLADECIFF
jgi:hypothetical protein